MTVVKVYRQGHDVVYLLPYETYEEAKRAVINTTARAQAILKSGDWYRHWVYADSITDLYIIPAEFGIAKKFKLEIELIAGNGSGSRKSNMYETAFDMSLFLKKLMRNVAEYNAVKTQQHKVVSMDFSVRQMYPTEKQIDIKKVLPWYGEYKDAYSDGRLFECEEILKAV